MPVDKAKVLLTKPTCHPERSRITRKAHDPAKSKDPYPIHTATSTARRFLTPGDRREACRRSFSVHCFKPRLPHRKYRSIIGGATTSPTTVSGPTKTTNDTAEQMNKLIPLNPIR